MKALIRFTIAALLAMAAQTSAVAEESISGIPAGQTQVDCKTLSGNRMQLKISNFQLVRTSAEGVANLPNAELKTNDRGAQDYVAPAASFTGVGYASALGTGWTYNATNVDKLDASQATGKGSIVNGVFEVIVPIDATNKWQRFNGFAEVNGTRAWISADGVYGVKNVDGSPHWMFGRSEIDTACEIPTDAARAAAAQYK